MTGSPTPTDRSRPPLTPTHLGRTARLGVAGLGIAGLVAAGAVSLVGPAAAVTDPCTTTGATTTCTFAYTGAAVDWTVPAGVPAGTSASFVLDGADGGAGHYQAGGGGTGGQTTFTYPIGGGDAFSISVGGVGATGDSYTVPAAGGFGGGGAGGVHYTGGGGGGGATTVAVASTALAVAGGGGGGADAGGSGIGSGQGGGGGAAGPASADRSGGPGRAGIGESGAGSSRGGDGGTGSGAGSAGAALGTTDGGKGGAGSAGQPGTAGGGKGGDAAGGGGSGVDPSEPYFTTDGSYAAGGSGGTNGGGGGGGAGGDGGFSTGLAEGGGGAAAGGDGGLSSGPAGSTYAVADNGATGGNGQVTISWTVLTPTTTSLISSVNPSVAGHAVRYVATITPDDPDVAGTVTFYDGAAPVCAAKPVTDDGASCDVTYPEAGSHTMTAVYSGDGTYAGSTSDPLTQVVNPAPKAQTITVTSTPPSPAQIGGSYTPVATSDSGLPVQVSIDASSTPSACSYDGTKVQLTGRGTCAVDYDQPGNDDYAPAQQVQQSFGIGAMSTYVSVAGSTDPSVYGQAVTLTASTSAADGSHPAGTVSFTVDGNPVGADVPVAADGSATSATLPALAPGHHSVTAGFHPTDGSTYQSTLALSGITVDQASTKTVVSVHQTTLAATVSALAPGSGTPTGTVTFTVDGSPVGTVALRNGSASLTGTAAPAGRVGATYNGDADFDMSTASTARVNPTITATLSSAHPKSHYGWYRSPVTVRFTCTTHGAPLSAPCPGPVTLRSNGADQRVSRSISATDGGMASIVVHVNLDQARPTVAVSGVRSGATYVNPPALRCVSKDSLSGVASCRIYRRTSGLTTYYTAVATDRAGNVASVHGRYTTVRMAVLGASFTHGAYNVRTVRTYTVVVYAASRPTYYDAAVYPRRPTPQDHAFHAAGPGRWTLGVTMLANLHTHPIWNIGAKVGRTMYVVRIRISG